MKNIYILIGIYIVALVLSIFGYLIDSDPIISSFTYQMFEVFLLSVFIFGILMLPVYIVYFTFRFFKYKYNRGQSID